jgi:tol-pal system protein YbgF
LNTFHSPRRSGLALVLALIGAAIAFCPEFALAQQSDVKPLLDRIDRLERDVNLLQRQVYRGTSPSGAPMPVSPPDTQSSLSNEVRIGQLEDQVRTLNGQLEEMTYNIDQLKRRLEALSGDIDQRFSALGPAGAKALANSKPPPGAPPPPMISERSPDAPPPDDAGDQPPPPPPQSRSGILGTLGGGTVAPLNAPPAPPPPQGPPDQVAAAPTNLPTGSPQEQYNYAFGLLRRADYGNAEQALKSFLQRYPGNELAGNAQYWLGETYYVRKDYENAATAFALGYQKYPKSGKASDNLLKLGMSLGNLGKKQEACSAFARLDRDFPTAPPNVKDRETNERQQVGCP